MSPSALEQPAWHAWSTLGSRVTGALLKASAVSFQWKAAPLAVPGVSPSGMVQFVTGPG